MLRVQARVCGCLVWKQVKDQAFSILTISVELLHAFNMGNLKNALWHQIILWYDARLTQYKYN